MTDLESAVMHILWKDSCCPSYFDGTEKRKQSLDRIAALRDWASTLTKEQGRTYYIKWLGYFESEHARYEHERNYRNSEAGRRDEEAKNRKANEKHERDIAMADTLPRPPV